MEQQQEAQWEERCRKEQEEEEEREALRIQEEELRLEMQRIAKKGYQDKVKEEWGSRIHDSKLKIAL